MAGDGWKAEWEHPQIFNKLMSPPPDPTPGEILPYNFDWENPMTMELLGMVNMKLIEHTRREHVTSLK